MVERLLAILQAALRAVEFGLASCEFIVALVEADFALFEFVFSLLNALVALAYFFFEFGLFVEKLFFYFQEFFLLDNLRLAVGFVEDAVVRFLQDISEKGVSAHCTDHEAGQNADQWFHNILKV